MPGHNDPVHLVSSGDPQLLTDNIVSSLLQHQDAAHKLCQERYQPYIKQLDVKISALEEAINPTESPSAKPSASA